MLRRDGSVPKSKINGLYLGLTKKMSKIRAKWLGAAE
jgi:hypothetical protein